MTQKDKQLLFKDLSARLPYGVKIYHEDFPNATLAGVVNEDIILHCDKHDYTYNTHWKIECIKPYLRPMSSMTDEEKFAYWKTQWVYQADYCAPEYFDGLESYDWLNKNHFDYRGLIEKGLAIDATGLNIY